MRPLLIRTVALLAFAFALLVPGVARAGISAIAPGRRIA